MGHSISGPVKSERMNEPPAVLRASIVADTHVCIYVECGGRYGAADSEGIHEQSEPGGQASEEVSVRNL